MKLTSHRKECTWFGFWLVQRIVCILCDWLERWPWFLVLRHSFEICTRTLHLTKCHLLHFDDRDGCVLVSEYKPWNIVSLYEYYSWSLINRDLPLVLSHRQRLYKSKSCPNMSYTKSVYGQRRQVHVSLSKNYNFLCYFYSSNSVWLHSILQRGWCYSRFSPVMWSKLKS